MQGLLQVRQHDALRRSDQTDFHSCLPWLLAPIGLLFCRRQADTVHITKVADIPLLLPRAR